MYSKVYFDKRLDLHDQFRFTFAVGASSSFYSERIDFRHCLAGESFWMERGFHKFANYNAKPLHRKKNSPEESKNAERQKVEEKRSRRERGG